MTDLIRSVPKVKFGMIPCKRLQLPCQKEALETRKRFGYMEDKDKGKASEMRVAAL